MDGLRRPSHWTNLPLCPSCAVRPLRPWTRIVVFGERRSMGRGSLGTQPRPCCWPSQSKAWQEGWGTGKDAPAPIHPLACSHPQHQGARRPGVVDVDGKGCRREGDTSCSLDSRTRLPHLTPSAQPHNKNKKGLRGRGF